MTNMEHLLEKLISINEGISSTLDQVLSEVKDIKSELAWNEELSSMHELLNRLDSLVNEFDWSEGITFAGHISSEIKEANETLSRIDDHLFDMNAPAS